MRKTFKTLFCLVVLAVMLAAMAAPALADVTRVKNLGDGSVEVRWDDKDVMALILVPKIGDDMDEDLDQYGYIYEDVGNGKTQVIYYAAPGQDYWIATLSSEFDLSDPYVYSPGPAPRFTEWRTQPYFSDWQLKEKYKNNKPTNLSALSARDLESQDDDTGYGVAFHYNYPQLKAERNYLGQIVITDPDGIPYVDYAFNETLSAGNTYHYSDYYVLDDYFDNMILDRGFVLVGVYDFSLYWDGMLVCSTTFRVR